MVSDQSPMVSTQTTQLQQQVTASEPRPDATNVRVRYYLKLFCGDHDGDTSSHSEHSDEVRLAIRQCIKQSYSDLIRLAERSPTPGPHIIKQCIDERAQQLKAMLPQSELPQSELGRATSEVLDRLSTYYFGGHRFQADMYYMQEGVAPDAITMRTTESPSQPKPTPPAERANDSTVSERDMSRNVPTMT